MQQEKSKLAQDKAREQKKLDELTDSFNQLSNKYEAAVKEKMLMKLEKDRLKARVDNLEISMNQESVDQALDGSLDRSSARHGQSAAKSQAPLNQ